MSEWQRLHLRMFTQAQATEFDARTFATQGRIYVCSYAFGTLLKQLDPHLGPITCTSHNSTVRAAPSLHST